jgi:DNA helicase-4
MALIDCPECSGKISDKAPSCPHCGLPASYFIKSKQATEIKDSDSIQNYAIETDINKVLLQFIKESNLLFNKDRYITLQEERAITNKYQRYVGNLPEIDLSQAIETLSNTLQTEPEEIGKNLDCLLNLENSIRNHNDDYIKSKLIEYKDYFDSILHSIDKNIKLDDDQRRAILIDESHCLIIAGAGAGKTTTMAAKVKFLIEKQNINPDDIFVISYTNKAIDELKDKINKKLKLPVKISTFHSFGFEIIRNTSSTIPQVSYQSYDIIYDFIYKKVFDNKKLLKNLLLFLGYYFDIPEDVMKFSSLKEYATYKGNLDYETIKSRLGEYIYETSHKRTKSKRTITGEFLRSIQEVQIANFLYLHNIDYEYEKPYKEAIPGSRKIYTPGLFY